MFDMLIMVVTLLAAFFRVTDSLAYDKKFAPWILAKLHLKQSQLLLVSLLSYAQGGSKSLGWFRSFFFFFLNCSWFVPFVFGTRLSFPMNSAPFLYFFPPYQAPITHDSPTLSVFVFSVIISLLFPWSCSSFTSPFLTMLHLQSSILTLLTANIYSVPATGLPVVGVTPVLSHLLTTSWIWSCQCEQSQYWTFPLATAVYFVGAVFGMPLH